LALKSETVTEDELTETQRAIESAFVFRFDSPQKIASRRAVMRLLGYPDQYDNNYIGGIQRLKPDEIRDVAARRWNIDGLNILVVGNREARDSLESVKQGLPEPLRDIEITELGFDEQLLGL
jgi:predicted Zn-dependent peptidase